MRRISNLFKSAAAMMGAGPQAICRVDGFDFSMEQKQGVLLTTKLDSEDESRPASTDSYYEIKIRPNGDNPEYPAADNASTHYCTIGLEGVGSGFVNSTIFAPAGSTMKNFELVEEFNDGRHTTGHRMPPHHSVMLRMHFQDAQGEKSSIGVGSWVRKSERESPAWKTASQCRIEYI